MNRLCLFLALIALGSCSRPLRREEVVVSVGDVRLAATLVTPDAPEPHPALLLLHGSGPDGRDNPYYTLLADAFVQRGFAVLTYDKRGCGASTGDWRRVAFGALIDDAVAVANELLQHPRVDATRVGVWGGSEGAAIAPEVALRVPSLRFVIMQSAPGVPFAEQNLHQTEGQVAAMTADEKERADAMTLQRFKHAFARSGSGWSEYEAALRTAAGTRYASLASPVARDDWWWVWYRSKMDFSPVPALERLTIPVMAIWGSADPLIPVEKSRNAVTVARRERAGHGDSILVIDGADHALYIGGLAGIWERGSLRNRPVHFDRMVEWALERVASAPH